jgi:aspartyl-tRNA(Asn)/glutamyl-tRNA(Gln) amidotransferase subunit A
MAVIKELIPFADWQATLQQSPEQGVDLVRTCLDHIQANASLNAFIRTYPDEALQKAEALAIKIQKRSAGKLAGLLVGIKDLLCYQDHPVQASSKILEGFISQFSATAVQRLLDEDAIILGHQNCDEFGMGSSNEHSVFGPTHNAIDPTRVPGGSSGGSAVAVQAGMCHISLGTDTGGSIRQPAAFCGIIGLKPTYGTISRHGIIAYASSFDTLGILARDIRDCAMTLEVIAGADAFDSTAARRPIPAYTDHLDVDKPFNIAYIEATLSYEGLQSEIREHTLATIQTLKKAGHRVEPVQFPLLSYTLPTYYVLTTAEASANLARFDGVRYGYRSPNATTLDQLYTQSRSAGFGPEVQRRILLGTFVLGAQHYDSCFLQAQKIRRLMRDQMEAIFKQYDYIILPTTPTTAFEIGRNNHDPVALYWADVYTTLASITGMPAISIPNGVDKNRLPIGLQVIADSFKEAELLGFANYLMQLSA